jgi:uncharacterized membrane protein YedE/YeeE
MLEALVESYGDPLVLFAGGLGVGVLFGALAQHSRFCLRSATIEFASLTFGPKLAVWLLTFSAAVLVCQWAILTGRLDVSGARQIAATGSLSGAIIGGLMFGVGMILARGCASRLLVLSATGNLRALVTGLILTIVAQASLRGALSPAREAVAGLWTVPGGTARDLLVATGIGTWGGLALGAGLFIGAIALALRTGLEAARALSAAGVGVAVALGWLFTYAMTQVSFEPLEAGSVSFTGPSADTLMGFVNERTLPLGFDVGLVPGVFLGSAAAALLAREFRLQGFEGGPSMLRYFAGAVLMGFGAMLAGGCAVGAGVTGGAIFALTSWVALAAMWAGAVAAQRVESSLERRGASALGDAISDGRGSRA